MTLEARVEYLRGEVVTIVHVALRDRKSHPAMPAVWRLAQVALDRMITSPSVELQEEGLREGLAAIVGVCLQANGSRNTPLAYVLDVAEQALERLG